MNHGICKVPGCTKLVRSMQATMCEADRQRWRRHGDARQETIRQTEVGPYVKKVERWIQRDPSGRIEAGLKKVKNILEGHARGIITDFKQTPMNMPRVKAAHELLKVYQDVDAVRCGVDPSPGCISFRRTTPGALGRTVDLCSSWSGSSGR